MLGSLLEETTNAVTLSRFRLAGLASTLSCASLTSGLPNAVCPPGTPPKVNMKASLLSADEEEFMDMILKEADV